MKTFEFTALDAPVRGCIHEDHDRLKAHKIRPALIVCGGGGYRFVNPREMDPPGLPFFAQGYQLFLLDYAVLEEAGDLKPLKQLAELVRILRERAEEWHIDPEKIAVMGFSAGGHLAASLGALWERKDIGLPASCRPDALILGYPVITLGSFTHESTARYITGGKEELRALLSVEDHVGPQFPPTFVWTTADDEGVPAENTLMLARALKKSGVSFECHIFAHGPHGMSNCTQETESRNPACAVWPDLAKTWINNLFSFIP